MKLFWEKKQLISFFYSKFTFKLSFFFRFSTWKWLVSSGNHATVTTSDWFIQSQPVKPVFKRILTKVFCQYILNLVSKKKLGSFNDLIINGYFQSFTYLPRYWYGHFLASAAASFVKFPWHYWREFSQSWKDLTKTLQSHGKLQSLTDLIHGANIDTHSNSRDWLFWMFMMSKINPLMNKSMLFWKDV